MPMIWPAYQPTVYVERGYGYGEARPCAWYQDLVWAEDMSYCRAPAVWLVIAAVGAATIWVMTRKR